MPSRKPLAVLPTEAQANMPTVPGLVLDPDISPSQTKNIELLKSGLFADFELVIGKKTWKLHRFVICLRSKFFQKALTGTWTEAQNKQVELQKVDFKEAEMDIILECIYSGDRPFSIESSEMSGFESCIRLYTHAEFLIIPELQTLAVRAVEKYRAKNPTKIDEYHRRYGEQPTVHLNFLDWTRAMEHLYKNSADIEKHAMRKAMLVSGLENTTEIKAARASNEFKGLVSREPRFARDWALGIISSSQVHF